MSKLLIKVEVLEGTDLQDALEEAKQKALAWDVGLVEFDFNGATFSISRDADICEVLEMYHALPKRFICK